MANLSAFWDEALRMMKTARLTEQDLQGILRLWDNEKGTVGHTEVVKLIANALLLMGDVREKDRRIAALEAVVKAFWEQSCEGDVYCAICYESYRRGMGVTHNPDCIVLTLPEQGKEEQST